MFIVTLKTVTLWLQGTVVSQALDTGFTSFTRSEERKWLTMRHDTVSNPLALRTFRDYTESMKAKLLTTLIRPEGKKKVQLVHSLAPALTLNHLANKPQQTTSALIPKDSTTAFTTD